LNDMRVCILFNFFSALSLSLLTVLLVGETGVDLFSLRVSYEKCWTKNLSCTIEHYIQLHRERETSRHHHYYYHHIDEKEYVWWKKKKSNEEKNDHLMKCTRKRRMCEIKRDQIWIVHDNQYILYLTHMSWSREMFQLWWNIYVSFYWELSWWFEWLIDRFDSICTFSSVCTDIYYKDLLNYKRIK